MIHIEALTKYYKDFCAVDQISFDIHKGEILGLLGPNGAGKTTTLRMLTGYLEPTDGSVRVKDYRIAENALKIKRLIGYLPESAPLYHEMIVYDYLLYVAGIRNLPKDRRTPRIRELADLCGLNAVMHKAIGVLSKGYKQRVGLAHAMMDDPEILVLDEPTSGLDPNQIVEIREIIRRIGKEKTVILSTHILSEAEATCDRVVIIHQGKIVADGSTETLKQTAGSETLIHLKLENADPRSAREILTAVNGVNELVPAEAENGVLGVKLSCSQNLDLMGRIYAAVKATDWVLLEFYQEARTLENIFRELTKEN